MTLPAATIASELRGERGTIRSECGMDKAERDRQIAAYGEGPAVLRSAWDTVPVDARMWSPTAADWSAHEIVIHCADSETYAATRIRLLAAEPQPVIVGYDQEAWVRAFQYDRLPVDAALAVIASVRALTLQVIEGFGDEIWGRTGTHTESGRYTAEDWLRTYSAHLHDHAAQIRANVESWKANPK
jgi:hypothetical protein